MSARVTYRLELAYDGAKFHGYARQPGLRTVDDTLRAAFAELIDGKIALPVGGRTDRGVHATGQVVSFWSRGALRQQEIADTVERVGQGDIAVMDLRIVPRWFHARYSALGRRYVYLHRDEGELDVARLDRMLCALVGRRCFSAFARDTPQGTKTDRTLDVATARRVTEETVRFDFAARSFLRKQVRVMVATALREALLGADDDALVQLAANGERGATPLPADPGGLYLRRVEYEPFSKR